MEKEVLLSILIPTYNGASNFLDETLKSIIEGVKLCEEGLIEVVLSNNASTDNTLEFLKQYDDYSYIRYHSNEENIGFARNIIRLTDEHARGKFGWVIGDDDLIIPQSIPAIIEELKQDCIDYLSVGFSFVRDRNYSIPEGKYEVHHSSFTEVLEHGKKGNILGTFMSSAIVRISFFKQVPKECITPKFDTYQSIFPNAYVNATAYHDKRCAYIADVVVLSFVHKKGWGSSDNMYFISTSIMPEFFNYVVSLGIREKDLRKITKKRILYNAVFYGYMRILRGKKVNKKFFSLLLKSFKYPSVHFELLKTVVSKPFRR